MAQLTNTFDSYSAVGNREDLHDIITNISPTDTPFQSAIRKAKAKAVKVEWTTDSLASAANNKQVEGNDIEEFTAVTATSRVDNYCQISMKEGVISGTQDVVDKAGKKSEIAYQIAKKGKELKRDIEFALTQNTTYVAGDSNTARQTRGLEGWVFTNDSMGTNGVSPVPASNTAGTDGTQRAFTETLLKPVLSAIYASGGDPDMIMVGPFNKGVFSTFTGGATRFDKAEDGKVYAAVDVYVSDFGTLKVVPNRFQRDRTAFVLETEKWELAWLRPIQKHDLAKTGDAEKFMLVCEYALKSLQEAASGAVRDLLTS